MFRYCFFIGVLLFFHWGFAGNVDVWKLKADKIDPSQYYGISVANGVLGIISSAEPFKVKEVVLAGVYDSYGRGRVSNFIQGFNILNLQIQIDGEIIQANKIKNYEQVLDMKKAVFITSFQYSDKALIRYKYAALRQLPFSALMDVEIHALKTISLGVASILEAPDALKEVENYYNEIERPHAVLHLLTSSAKSPTGKLKIVASNTFLLEENHHLEPKMIHEMWDNNMHLMKFNKTVEANTTYCFGVVSSTISSAHHSDPLNEAERISIFAKLEGKKRLWERHENEWSDLWKSHIEIEGDEQTQQDINSMLYHLYSFNREGASFSSSPMGLSGLGYNGHVFWDTELWMYPALLLLHPPIAKGMIEYRFERLEAAKKNAFSKGYKGAMFPWESAESGAEETPVWALSGPFEHHITGCVAWATWNYFASTQDKEWLKHKGWKILEETANFWASRVEEDSLGYHIYNVVAADEWAENVDDNAFTNAIAKKNLEIASEAALVLGYPSNPQWEKIAKGIVFSKMQNGVTKEHKTYQGENIKQADVNLLAYPLNLITDEKDILKDLGFYSTRVPNEGTPSMTQAVFSILYSRLGDGEKAYFWFKDAYKNNLNPPFQVIAETKGGTNPYFATGAGGVLQSLLMGFGGLEITSKGIVQKKSKLPSQWKSLRLKGIGVERKTYLKN